MGDLVSGTTLQSHSISHLQKIGINAIVVTTTNSFAAHIMEKHGFIRFKGFSYEHDFGLIGLPGTISIWYKIF